jgi:hypothetical protein
MTDTDEPGAPMLQRELLMSRPGQTEKTPLVLQIYKPYWTEENSEAACPLKLNGLLENLPAIRSIDPISAVQQAIEFADTTLRALQEQEGFRFYWTSGDDYFE